MAKAWYAYSDYEESYVVVFAETRSKARKYIKETEEFDYYDYIEIKPRRLGCIDYLDKPDGYVMDWNKQEDRLALVKDAGWYCVDPRKESCEKCSAKEQCDSYLDLLEGLND